MDDVAGEASANDATAVATIGLPPGQEDPFLPLEEAVRACERKVSLLKEHLAGAEAGLKAAQEALAALNGGTV